MALKLVLQLRNAPKKQKITFNLELQAVVSALGLRQLIVKGLDIHITNVYHWTDSLTVVQWLRSGHMKQQTFVANRIGEIADTSPVDE